MSSSTGNGTKGQAEDEDDDYMNMTFDDPTPAKETSLQRTERLKKESRQRGIIKSKAQIAEEEEAVRDKALATSLLDDPKAKKSKGLSMMAKMGFSGGTLGKKTAEGEASGIKEPLKLHFKDDKGGIGMENEKKRKFREAAKEQELKAPKLDPLEYRDRVRKEREEARLEKQFYAAQRMAERMDDESQPDGGDVDKPDAQKAKDSSKPQPLSSRPLKSVPVLYRGLIRHREEQERDRRMRHDLEQSLSRLPTYEDEDEDEDDKKALGRKQTTYVTSEDFDEEDEELDEFNALEIAERLNQVLGYLRGKHRYCFWCKMSYPDEEMEGCPGFSEEDHD